MKISTSFLLVISLFPSHANYEPFSSSPTQHREIPHMCYTSTESEGHSQEQKMLTITWANLDVNLAPCMPKHRFTLQEETTHSLLVLVLALT